MPEKSLHDLDRRNRVAETLKKSRHAFNVYTEALVTSGEMTSADLRPAFCAAYERVLERGAGVCSRCDWRRGCDECDPFKALRFYVRKELSIEFPEG